MTTPYNSSEFDTHKCVGGTISYPFRNLGDGTTKVYTHFMVGNRSTYAPLADNDVMTAAGGKPPRSPFADDSGAYYVGDTEPTDKADGTVMYNRIFANIPADRTDGLGVFPFNYAASSEYFVNAGTPINNYATSSSDWFTSTTNISVGSSVTILTVDASGNRMITLDVSFDLTSSEVEKLYVGQAVRITYDGGTLANYGTDTLKICQLIQEISGNTVTVRIYKFSSSNTSLSFAATTSVELRPAVYSERTGAAVAPSAVQSFRYVKTNDITTTALNKKFEVFSPYTGDVGFYLARESSPTAAEYCDLIQAGTLINAEDEKATRWLGNIWELSTIKVPAR